MFSVLGVLRRSGVRALACALLVTAIVVSGVAASNQKPFSGTVSETFAATGCPSGTPPGLLCAASSGPGKLSVIGNVTSSFLATVDPVQLGTTGCSAETSSGTLTASNGDQIFITDSETRVCLTSATTGMVTGDFNLTGGSGRFSGATGHGHFTASINFNAAFVGSSLEIYTGTISLPGRG